MPHTTLAPKARRKGRRLLPRDGAGIPGPANWIEDARTTPLRLTATPARSGKVRGRAPTRGIEKRRTKVGQR